MVKDYCNIEIACEDYTKLRTMVAIYKYIQIYVTVHMKGECF